MHCAVVGCFRPDFGGPWLILNQGKFQFHWALYPMQVYKGNEGWLSGQSSCTAKAEWQADSPTTVPSFSLCLHKVKNQAYVNAIVAHFSYQVSLPSILSAKYTSYTVSIRTSAFSFQMCLLSTCAVWLFRVVAWQSDHTVWTHYPWALALHCNRLTCQEEYRPLQKCMHGWSNVAFVLDKSILWAMLRWSLSWQYFHLWLTPHFLLCLADKVWHSGLRI